MQYMTMVKTNTKSERTLTIRLPSWEAEQLEEYCRSVGRTRTDVIREWIRKHKPRHNHLENHSDV